MRSEVLDFRENTLQTLKENSNKTVGPTTGDYTTINEALEFFSRYETEYKAAGIDATITLQPDYVMEEQVLVNGKDLGWIKIISDSGASVQDVVAFTQGSKVPGIEQAEESQVTIAEYTVNDTNFASVLNGDYFQLENGNGNQHYFWYRVPTKARADLGSVLATYDTVGTAGNAFSIETVISGTGTALSSSFASPVITINLATVASAVQASTSIENSDQSAAITVAAAAGQEYDGQAGNDIEVYFVDSSEGAGAGTIAATYSADYNGLGFAAIEVDFDGTDQTAADIQTAIEEIDDGATTGSDFAVTIDTAGTFTLNEDLGGVGTLEGGLDAGDADPTVNTASAIATEIDGISGFVAVASGSSPITTASTYNFVNGGDGATDPALAGTGHEVLLTETTTNTAAATETQGVVDALADFSAVINSLTARRVDITNADVGDVTDIVVSGSNITGGVITQGVDEQFQVKVNVFSHGFTGEEKIVIKNHQGTTEEVNYNGSYTVSSVNIETDSFEIDSSGGVYWDSNRAGIANTAELYENLPVIVNRESLTQQWEFFYYPAFGVARGTLPLIGCLFEMDETGDNGYGSYKDGLCATDQGIINVLPEAGFTNAGGTNFYGTRNSRLNGNDGIFDGGKRYGIWAYATTVINARRASVKNCGDPSLGSVFDVTGNGYDESGQSVGSGIVATRSSIINASGATVTGSYGDNILAEFGAQINLAAHDGGEVYTVSGSTVGTNFRTIKGGMIFGIGTNRDTLRTNSLEIDNLDINGTSSNITIDVVQDFPSNPAEGRIVFNENFQNVYLFSKTNWLSVVSAGPAATLTWNSASDTYTNHRVDVSRIHAKIRRCVLNNDGTVNYYLHPNDSTLKIDGTAATLDGSHGNVMVEIPKFYVRTNFLGSVEDRRYTWEISDLPLEGFVIHPAFMLNGTEKDYRYISAYDACIWDDSAGAFVSGLNYDDNTSRIDLTNDYAASVSGVYPMVGITRAESRTLASNLGGVWHLQDFYLSSAIQLLILLEYGTFNLQAAISEGNVNGTYLASSGLQADQPASIAGLSNSLGNFSGGVSTSGGNRLTDFVSYRGIENFFGNVWNWVDGFNINDRQAYVSNVVADFADDTSTNYTTLGSVMPSSSNYVRDIQNLEFAFLPSSVSGGSSSTYLTDYYYQNTGWRVARLGGNANYGLRAGAWAWSVSNDAANATRSIGFRSSV